MCHLRVRHSCSRGFYKTVSTCLSRNSARVKYVALACGIKGLGGRATGVSISIYIVKQDTVNKHNLSNVDAAVSNSMEM